MKTERMLDHKNRVSSLIREGREALSQKNYSSAISHFDRALALSPGILDVNRDDPDGIRFLCDYIEVLMRLSQNEKALALAEEKTKLLSDALLSEVPRLRLVVGELYSSLGRAEEAENELLV